MGGGGGGGDWGTDNKIGHRIMFLLVVINTEWSTYDQLDPVHWMAGCLKCAADISESDRPKHLQYITDLLQDAADFSFESAKAYQAMVLTTMEFDRIRYGMI